MKYLSPENAQRIADRIMEIVPYNINIMNTEGVIIASGDITRIGSIHKGAVRAIQQKDAYIVYKDTETERKGINLPIWYNYEIAGIIGISGDVQDVFQIGQIVVTTAQLMIENDVYNDLNAIKKNRLNDFFFEWCQRKEEDYSEKFITQAEYFHIDLRKERIAVWIDVKRVRFSIIEQLRLHLQDEDYIVRQGMEHIVILFDNDKRFEKRIKDIMEISGDFIHCYVGEVSKIAYDTVNSAEKVKRVAGILKKEDRIVTYKELRLECLFIDNQPDRMLQQIAGIFEKQDKEKILQETITVYIEHNEELSRVCEELHIHRNTLNYRMDRIHELTGLSPRNGKELMLLYMAVVQSAKM